MAIETEYWVTRSGEFIGGFTKENPELPIHSIQVPFQPPSLDFFWDSKNYIPGPTSASRDVKEAFETLAPLEFVNVFDDSGTTKIRLADASAFATRAHGFVLLDYTAGEQAVFFIEGVIDGFVGLTIGDPVFLDVVAGQVTQTPPSTIGSDAVWQKVGTAFDTTRLRVEIDAIIEL